MDKNLPANSRSMGLIPVQEDFTVRRGAKPGPQLLSPVLQLLERLRQEPALRNKRSRHSGMPALHNQQQPSLSATEKARMPHAARESPRARMQPAKARVPHATRESPRAVFFLQSAGFWAGNSKRKWSRTGTRFTGKQKGIGCDGYGKGGKTKPQRNL